MRKTFASLFLIGTAIARNASASPCGPGYPLWAECDNLAGLAVHAVQALGEIAAAKRNISLQLGQARRRYFATYPNGPGHAQAEKEFLDLLDEKDLWHLYLYAYLGPAENVSSGRKVSSGQPPLSDGEMAIVLDKLLGLGVSIDGGVNPFAGFQFDDWVAAIKRSSSGFIPTAFAQLGNPQARIWRETGEQYWRYRIARNWAEFSAAGRNLTDDPKMWLRLLFVIARPWNGLQPGQTQLGLADGFYQLLANAFGEDAILRAAKQVIAAPKAAYGKVTLAGQPALKPYDAFGRALGETSERNFGLMNAIQWEDPFTGEQRIRAAQNIYKKLGAIYGDALVASTAASLRHALNGRTLDEYGKKISIPDEIERQLQAKDTRYFVRAILAEHDRLSTQADVDRAFAKLAVVHGDKAVIAAGNEILAFLKVPSTSIPVSFRRSYRGPGDVYDWLAGIVDGSVKLPRPQASDLAENPDYVAWAKYPAHTAVVYGGREWGYSNGKPALNSISREPFGYWVEVRSIYSIDDRGVLVERHKRPFVANNVYPVSAQSESFVHRMNPQQLEESQHRLRKAGTTLLSETTGTEQLEVNGKTYDTHWKRVVTRSPVGISGDLIEMTTRWNSDTVPGGLVRERVERSVGHTIAFEEVVIQNFPVDNLATLPSIPKESMFLIKPELPFDSTEATRIAQTLPTVPLPADANPGKLFEGQVIQVTTVDIIDVPGIQAGKKFLARLEDPLWYRRELAVQVGADIYLKVRGNASGVTATVDSVVIGGKSYPVVTNECLANTRVLARATDAGESRPPARRGPAGRAQAQMQARGVPPGTPLLFLVLQGRN